MNEFEALGLSGAIVRTLGSIGFEKPTDIQANAIPHMLDSKDLMGLAETGGGKTGAFLLPVLEQLSAKGERATPRSPEVLILAPTRELAGQIGTALGQFSRGLKIFHTTIFGGAPYIGQIKAMERGVHILIATPGRLMDHMKRGTVKLGNVKTLILDEADRMLDLGFKDDVTEISGKMPEIRQTVMFSATMNRGVSTFADTLLDDPVRLEVTKTNTVNENIDHYVLACKGNNKEAVLDFIMEEGDVEKAIIFTRTKVMADKLAFDLKKKGLACEALHGDHRQTTREKVLRKFRSGTIKFLAATDVAARGIDVRDITHVINYDMPLEADGYVHRAGRTGRAGDLGLAFSIVAPSDVRLLRQVERIIGESIPIFKDHPFHIALSESRPPNRSGGRGGYGRGGKSYGKKEGGQDDWRDRKRNNKNKKNASGSTYGKRPAAEGNYDPTARDVRDANRAPAHTEAGKPKHKADGKAQNKSWAKKADDGKRMDKRVRKYENPEGKSEGKSFDKPAGKKFDKPEGRSFDKPRKPKTKKPAGKGWAKPGKPTFAKKGKSAGKPGGRPNVKAGARSGGDARPVRRAS